MRIRLAFAACVVLLGACKTEEDNFPVLTGGGGSTTGNGGQNPDAGTNVDASDAGAVIHGLVCMLPDPRDLTTCATTGAGSLNVTLDGVTVLTADNGTFTMPLPAGTNLMWQVVGPNVITSLMSFSAIAVVPTINATVYHDLQSTNGDIDVMGEGAIMARVLQAGAPLTGATAVTNPSPDGQPLYDGSSATTWNQNSTGPRGTMWVPGLTAGTPTTLTITPNGGTALVLADLTVGDESITYLTVDVPQ